MTRFDVHFSVLSWQRTSGDTG